jgi:cytochrome c-type biogenesis protein
MNEGVGLLAALTAGLISFISPCVLPVVPAYLSFVSGLTIDEMRGGGGSGAAHKRRVLANCLSFVAGFSLVFIALGASATWVGAFLNERMLLLSRIAGVVIVFFGLNTLGLVKIPFLNYEKRFHQNSKAAGLMGSFIVGLAFAFGWTPCIGPILGAILGVASTRETVAEGMVLLSAYSLGLGIPFLLAGISVDRFFHISSHFKKQFKVIEIVSGVFMIVVGIMIFFNWFTVLSGTLSQWFPWLMELG